jgi:hypothetical protein
MPYKPEDLAALSTVKGDPAADTWDKFDLGGNLLWDFGGQVKNKEIDKKVAKLAAMRQELGQDRFDAIMKTVEANGGDWNDLENYIYGDNGNKLEDFFSGVEKSDQGNLQDLLGNLGGYKNSADFFKDPNFMGDAGDVRGYQGPSSATMGAQKDALQQFKNLSTPTETAQEKLVRMMAQRQMENNLAGDRDALARSLKSRGVYGSGAEITGNMMAQGQEADRAALANMQANAQAQNRAMQALGSYSSLAGGIRNQEMQEGSLAQEAAKFNNTANQANVMGRGHEQIAATQAGEAAKGQRAVQGYGAQTGVNKNIRDDAQSKIATHTGTTQGGISNRLSGTGLQVGALDKEDELLKNTAAGLQAQKSSGGILG